MEAAKRKGVSTSAMSYIALSSFENTGAYTPPVLTIDADPIINWQQPSMTAVSNPSLESIPVTAITP
jgi:hypothetical protein